MAEKMTINPPSWSELPPQLLSAIGKLLENRLDRLIFRSVCKKWRASLPDWSDLSLQILLAIGTHLENRLDICRFRAVCKKWRVSLPLPESPNILFPHLPQQIPHPSLLPFNEEDCNDLDLVPIAVFLVKPALRELGCLTNGWILTIEEREPGRLRTVYPITSNPFKGTLPTILNLSDFRLLEIGKGYCFRSWSGLVPDCKVIVCSSNAFDFTAIVLYSKGYLFCLRSNNGRWEFQGVNSNVRFNDIICYKERVYAVCRGGRLYVIDHLTSSVADTVVHGVVCGIGNPIQLAVSCQELFLVVKDKVKVYKLNEEEHNWEAVKSLEDKIMFLGRDCCFLVSSEDVLPQKESFYVSSSSFYSRGKHTEKSTEFFGVSVYCLESVSKNVLCSYFQFVSFMLWPPSTWLFPDIFPPRWVFEKVEDVQIDGGSSTSNPEQTPSTDEEHTAVPNIDVESPFEEQIPSSLSLDDSTVDRHNEASDSETPEQIVSPTDSEALQIQPSENDAPSTDEEQAAVPNIDVESPFEEQIPSSPSLDDSTVDRHNEALDSETSEKIVSPADSKSLQIQPSENDAPSTDEEQAAVPNIHVELPFEERIPSSPSLDDSTADRHNEALDSETSEKIVSPADSKALQIQPSENDAPSTDEEQAAVPNIHVELPFEERIPSSPSLDDSTVDRHNEALDSENSEKIVSPTDSKGLQIQPSENNAPTTDEEQAAVPNIHVELPFEERIPSSPSLDDSTVDRYNEALDSETSEKIVSPTDLKALEIQPSEDDASMAKFHLIAIQANLLPILRKVWLKYGDIIKGSGLRNDTRDRALECLAKMIRILQTNSAKTLTEEQASYLSSSLSDLQLMQLKVDWLVPFVDEALRLHGTMQLEAVLAEIDKAKVMAETLELSVVEMVAEVKQKLERDRKVVSDSLLVMQPGDYDKCLGEDLC